MKDFILSSVLFLSVYAIGNNIDEVDRREISDYDYSRCVKTANWAEALMRLRQDMHPMDEVLAELKDRPELHAEVISVYSTRWTRHEQLQNEAVEQYRESALLTCVKSMREK